jgi:hypothetical protein
MTTLETHERNRSLSPTVIDFSQYPPDPVSEQDGQTPPPAKRKKSSTLAQAPLLAVEPMADSPDLAKDSICTSSVLSEGKPVDPDQVSDGIHETKSGEDQEQPSTRIMSPIDLRCQSANHPVSSTTDMKDCLGDGLSKNFAEESDEYYDVGEILDHDIYKGHTRYYVQWEGYDDKTWEGEENFEKCQQLLTDYWKSLYVSLFKKHMSLKKQLRKNE